MGRDGQGRSIYRHSYENPEGLFRQAVFWMREAGSEEYRLFYRVVDGIKWFILPIYLGTAAFCIFWLSRRVKRLLAPLNDAAANLAADRPSGLEGYSGPAEFKELADNFLYLEKALQKSEEERQRLDGEKRKLLSDISHDLKTPVTVIQGYAAALRDGLTAPEDQKKYLDAISRKADRVSELLQTFHEYSRLDRPDMPVSRRREDLCGLVREYFRGDGIRSWSLRGSRWKRPFRRESIPACVDRALLRTRHGEHREQRGRLQSARNEADWWRWQKKKERAKIRIADDGNGIPEELKRDLFRPFATGDAARGSGHGSGLGLAITAKILELHGGSVRLEETSPFGKGAAFLLVLPLEQHGAEFDRNPSSGL